MVGIHKGIVLTIKEAHEERRNRFRHTERQKTTPHLRKGPGNDKLTNKLAYKN